MTLTRSFAVLIGACLAAQNTTPSLNEVPIQLNVVVTGADGNAIGGLGKNQFHVYDDDVQQQVTLFSVTDEPASVAVIVGNPRRAASAFAAVFLETLRPDDWRALITYDRHTNILTDFTRNRYKIATTLKDLPPPRFRESQLYDALYETIDRMDGVEGRKAIVLVSSGLDVGKFSEHPYQEILKRSLTSETPIYAVSVTHTEGALSDPAVTGGGMTPTRIRQVDNAMKLFAENSGGAVFFLKYEEDFQPFSQTINNQIRYGYTVGFVPADRKKDGKLHKLRLEVGPLDLNHDGKPDKLKVQYRHGYNAAVN